MRTFILTAVAVVSLGIGLAPQEASARWVYKSTIRWDSRIGSYVTHTEQVWVPDVVIVPVPVRVVVDPYSGTIYPRPVTSYYPPVVTLPPVPPVPVVPVPVAVPVPR